MDQLFGKSTLHGSSLSRKQRESIPLILIFPPDDTVPIEAIAPDIPPRMDPKLHQLTRKFSTILEEQSEAFFNPPPKLWFPPLYDPILSLFAPWRFPPLSFIPLFKLPKNLPPSTHIRNQDHQIKCILHYEDLIYEVCDDETPTLQDDKQQQPEELTPAETLANRLRKIIANRLREDVATDGLAEEPMGKKPKRFHSLHNLKSRMSGSVRK
jgi:hypothetical protein